MDPNRLRQLLELAKTRLKESKEDDNDALTMGLDKLARDSESATHVSLEGTGLPANPRTEPEVEATTEFLTTVAANQVNELAGPTKRDVGVTRDVSLNTKQQLFMDTMLSGEDIVLIGAAGTGKTTCVGKTIAAVEQAGICGPLSSGTKYLHAGILGILVTSFTRKAVNNIRRAVPDAIKPHVLTLHKVLEFSPTFYEIEDPNNPGVYKNTMKFEPKRNEINPLPSDLKVVCFEESSMIGTDLYNAWRKAVPHNPQEIFIGDIRQLPPVFGSAILGFKMALLPVVELDEVYRQAKLSPIIRLAHTILSGDASKFDPTCVVNKEKHPHLDKIVQRKKCPALEAFNENTEHGMVKFQIWQKTMPSEVACNATIQQFIAWSKEGYYNANDDLILCPFNKAFGTIELNKGIHQYLGKLRGATVHEIIAGFNTHYLAVGDRVLYDKEDAIITSIRRNMSYLGKSPRPASPDLDRWGSYQQELTEEERNRAAQEEADSSDAAMDEFFTTYTDDEGDSRVNLASHIVTVRFTFGESEETELSDAAEINNLLGGHAITVHKAQGSENHAIFLVLHSTHQMMCQNELLYTAVTRARHKLHIICETDTFFKGVKSQKVKGFTLKDKIDTFRGKTSFDEYETQMRLEKARAEKKKREAAASPNHTWGVTYYESGPIKPTESVDQLYKEEFPEPEPIQLSGASQAVQKYLNAKMDETVRGWQNKHWEQWLISLTAADPVQTSRAKNEILPQKPAGQMSLNDLRAKLAELRASKAS